MSEPNVRLNKYLADLGIASRREADLLIADGKIKVNGKIGIIGQKISNKDKVEVVGQTGIKEYLAYYKGRGIIAHSPSEGETDIKTQLQTLYPATSDLAGISPIGRLDKDSEGLLILSNDGRLTEPLLDPKAGHEKEYEVLVDKKVTGRFLMQMENGVDIEGYKTKKARAIKKSDVSFLLTLTEGKKHQIRRMCAALGYQVKSLKRVRILNIELGLLKPNQYRKLSGKELKDFLHNLRIN